MDLPRHDRQVPEKPIRLSPVAQLREPGGIHNIAKSAIRAFDVLELLIEARRPLRAIEIVHRFALSPSSVDQILKTLVDGGYLIFDPFAKRYDLSARLLRLGPVLRRKYFSPIAIARLLRLLQRDTGYVVTLAASQGHYMQVMDSCSPRRQQSDTWPVEILSFRKGQQMPMFGTCSGTAWLSSQSEVTIMKAIAKCRREFGEDVSDVEYILDGIRQVKEQGYAAAAFITNERLWSVAVPTPPAANSTVMVVTISGPRQMIENRSSEIASLMKETIHHYLG